MAEDIGEAISGEDFPPGMAPKILNMTKAVNQLEESLDPLVSQPSHEIHEHLSAMERAKVGMLEIYAINSLFWVMMKTSGEDVDPALREDYKVEMGRLKEAQGRLSELEARANRSTIDRQAAERFIRRGLGQSTRRSEENDNGEHNRDHNRDHNKDHNRDRNKDRNKGRREGRLKKQKRESAVKMEDVPVDFQSPSVECIDVDDSTEQEQAFKENPKKTERNWYDESWA